MQSLRLSRERLIHSIRGTEQLNWLFLLSVLRLQMRVFDRRFLLIVALLTLSARPIHAESVGECRITETGEEVCEKDLYNDEMDYDDDDAYQDDDSKDDNDYDAEEECVDTDELCGFWAEEGECLANPGYMHRYCPVSCNTCPDDDDDEEEADDFDTSNAMKQKENLLRLVKKYGEPQTVEGVKASATLQVIKETLVYMKNFVHRENPTHKMSPQTIERCRNRDPACSFWATIGECDVNPAYMATTCAPSCKSCHLIDITSRCPIDTSLEPSLKPGDLNKMFERNVKEASGGSKGYTVTVHSRPSVESISDPVISEEKDMEQPPWVITFDDFLSDEECDHLIRLGYEHEYKRSEDVGEEKFDGTFDGMVSLGRTSENAWCSDHSGCRDDPIVAKIYDKMSHVIDIPPDNSEDLQILKYEVGQFYNQHHDYIENQRDRQNGPRILTILLYLNDDGLEGGGTRFGELDPPLTINPKKGRALLWPSVLNSKPRDQDERMEHEALPVEKGTKFAANAWIHLFDNRGPEKRGCT